MMSHEIRSLFRAGLQSAMFASCLLVVSLGQAQELPLPQNDAARSALIHLLGGFSDLDRQFADRIGLDAQVHRVRAGETLDMIIDSSVLASLPVRRSILRQAFVAANPHAFRRSSPHFLFAGVDLRLPGPEHLSGVVFTDERLAQGALETNSRRRAHWIRYP